MKEGINAGVLYLSLYNLLRRRYGIDRPITRKELFCELGKHFLVPKSIKPVVIKEMELRKLIEIEDKHNIRLLNCDLDFERDTKKFLERMGL